MQMKKWSSDSVWFINGLMLGVATMLIGLVLFSNWVHAATYNVLFNNVEQGANGTANPRVDVSNGKATKTADADLPAPAETAATPNVNVPVGPAPITPQTPNATSTASVVNVAPEPEHSWRPVRIGLFASRLGVERTDDSNPVGGSFSLGFFPLRDFGLNAFVGSTGSAPHAFYGGELEFIPIRAGIFGWENALEVKAMVGASTLGRDLGTGSRSGSILGGLGATVNFGNRYGLTAAMRTNLSERSNYQYWLADAGLVVRF